MERDLDVICLGAALVDMVAQVKRHPIEDDEVFVSDLKLLSGGAAANTAYACAKLGLKTAFIGKLGYIYDVNRSDNSTYYYWVTNALGSTNYQRYWNTKLKEGEAWNGASGLINQNAKYPDGRYRIWVMAYDIEENGGDTLNRVGAEDEDVLLDNFAPFVEKVVVRVGGEVKYEGEWELVGSENIGSGLDNRHFSITLNLWQDH